MKLQRIFVATVSSILICSCAGSYVPPISGPTALLKGDERNTNFAVADDNGCGRLRILKNGEVIVPANNIVFVHPGFMAGGVQCDVLGYFTPEDGKEYQVAFGLDQSRCYAWVNETSSAGKVKISLNRAYRDKWTGLTACTDKGKL
ncbi:Uncharacterised protein [BD1-7 clade bacterium]|nr:Uncharacterised protein [BD1-7 clade bacterium]